MSASRTGDHLALGYTSQANSSLGRSTSPTTKTSPIDPSSAGSGRSPFGISPGLQPLSKMANSNRSGAGSPSHDMTGRLFSKRAREIQAQEGVPGLPVNLWGGPPTSGNSTPLRENIPESPTDGFPDFAQASTVDSLPSGRRARAGTVPSRFSPGGVGNGLLNLPSLASKTSRPTPSHSPFKSPSPGLEPADNLSGGSALLSRLRAGSMPQRSPYPTLPGSNSPFGPSIFGGWNTSGRERGATLASIASLGSNGLSSPAQSAFSREGTGENDAHMRTLDYLGLAETPQPATAQLATAYIPTFVDFSKSSRFRSYSVNNKDKYADDDEDPEYEGGPVGNLESQYVAHLQDQLAATNAAIHNHNLAVQAFASQAAVSRPRARTAGVLDAPASRLLRNYYPTPSRLDNTLSAAEMQQLQDEKEVLDLPQAVAAMSLSRSNSSRHNPSGLLTVDEQGLEGPTSALWLGSIPASTTTSTLTEMFKSYGPILSARVLTHKSCGFVNFEKTDSAIAAKASLNGKEIFPGAGPIRINFAKPPSASNTPGHDGAYPSPSPDPFAKGYDNRRVSPARVPTPGEAKQATSAAVDAVPVVPALRDMVSDVLEIVGEFEATDEDRYRISMSIQQSIQYTKYVDEIPPIKEPAHTRVHDAPKLRDIRKRIDNQTLSRLEIENIAMEMLPEIAELSSDYLGNTVVQKLFEHCSDDYRDAMLGEIAPHMAEIGVHKNGTWAAQKIIDVCKTPHQMTLIVEHLRPYVVPLFLDQYGNYVLQGCLKFGSPYNDFIFETMLSKVWDIAQGRYGARAMRACLESHHSTKDQQRMLAAAISLHSVELATNQNGALLLTWFLDTCTFPHRRTVLAPRLVPYLVHLCTHKVAYMTVLKVINQKAEPDARDTILQAMFFSPGDRTLEAILRDHTSGATLIFKVLTTPFFDESIRSQVVDNVKSVLVRIKAQPGQGYKRLMDEVGLSTRGGSAGSGGGAGSAPRDHAGSSPSDRPRPGSRQMGSSAHHTHPQQPHTSQQGLQHQQTSPQGAAQHGQPTQFSGSGQFYNTSGYDAGYSMPRSESVDSNMSQQFPAFNPQGSMFSTGQAAGMPQLTLQQLQYQQSLMNSRAPAINGFYGGIQAGFPGYSSPSPSIDQYRGQPLTNGSPGQTSGPGLPATPQSAFGTPGFGANGMGVGGFAYPGMPSFQYTPEQPVSARRGRVGQPADILMSQVRN